MDTERATEFRDEVRTFVQDIVSAMGLEAEAQIQDHADGLCVEVSGAEASELLRRKGEGLDALQQVVNAAYRRDLEEGLRIVVDACGFRQGKDNELRQMARFLMERVKATGGSQEIGPLNSYSRRIVHLEVATDPELASESQGDGATKLVIITRKP
ncbi:MAG: protein jag [Vicinamibacteraceae bacterium]